MRTKSVRRRVPRSWRKALLIVGTVAGVGGVVVAKDFSRPTAHPAKTYPAHDEHITEKLAIAADPYDTPEKANIFSVNFHEHGFLPVFFVITNDGDQPVSLANMDVKLITANRSKLSPVSADDLYRRLANPQARTTSPIPLPRKKVKGTISPKETAEIESSQFAAKAVEPHNTQSGFLFFDVAGISAPLPGASIYITGVADAKGTELMYFEISMDGYLKAPRSAY
jgi:hypothetical protein